MVGPPFVLLFKKGAQRLGIHEASVSANGLRGGFKFAVKRVLAYITIAR